MTATPIPAIAAPDTEREALVAAGDAMRDAIVAFLANGGPELEMAAAVEAWVHLTQHITREASQ